jgi:hypothetical protein
VIEFNKGLRTDHNRFSHIQDQGQKMQPFSPGEISDPNINNTNLDDIEDVSSFPSILPTIENPAEGAKISVDAPVVVLGAFKGLPKTTATNLDAYALFATYSALNPQELLYKTILSHPTTPPMMTNNFLINGQSF